MWRAVVAGRMIEGTRYATLVRPAMPSTRHLDRGYTRDVGLLPAMTGAVVFSGSTATAPGAFAGFQQGEVIAVEGSNLNNGLFIVLAASSDALTLYPTPSPETAASCIIRAFRNVFAASQYFLLGGNRMLLGGQPASI